MDIKCRECGNSFDVNLSNCPKCGVANPYKKGAEDIVPGTSNLETNNGRITNPRTIEELQEWYVQEKLPSENTTRFFIGKNIKSAKAFGIYKDDSTGKFVVYKNKADGSRAVRYEGKDEAYAVNEIWNKLKSEILNQKQVNKQIENDYYTSKSKGNYSSGSSKSGLIVIGIIVASIFGMYTLFKNIPNRGYYNYNDTYYYYQSGSWYEYDNGWTKTDDIPKELKKNQKDYYNSYSFDSSYYIPSFESSSYYVEPSSSSSSSSWDDDDDDYSWSSDDSWDSSSTDWDSDW